MLGYRIDPFVISLLVGIVWPLVQHVAQRGSWTGKTKRFVALGFAVVASFLVWFAGAYPASWELFTAQFLIVFGAGQAVYSVLKSAGVLDWANVSKSDTDTVDGVFDYVAKHSASASKLNGE